MCFKTDISSEKNEYSWRRKLRHYNTINLKFQTKFYLAENNTFSRKILLKQAQHQRK